MKHFWKQKQGVKTGSRELHMSPAHNTTTGVGKPPKLPLWPNS